MAFVGSFTCGHCQQPKTEVVDRTGICAQCRTAIARADEDAHMAKLQALPIEERIRRLELELYRTKAADRLDALERRFATY